MKRITFICGILISLGACSSETEKTEDKKQTSESEQVDDKPINEEETEVIESDELSNEIAPPTEVDVEALIKEGALVELKNKSRAEIFSGNGPDDVEINSIAFRPNDACEHDYFMIQIKYRRGDVIEDDFVVIYPHFEGGTYEASQYRILEAEDRPCNICTMESVTSSSEADPVGEFTDNSVESSPIITKSLGYNLAEMSFYWF